MKEQVNIAPDVISVYEAIASGRFEWKTALGEWIDNAFDANAMMVSFAFNVGTLCIADDGDGASSVASMLKLGSHQRHGTTRLGRYGIGGKEAALLVGGVDSQIKVVTVHKGQRRVIVLLWRKVADGIVDVESHDADTFDRGTTITISQMQHRVPKADRWEHLVRELGYLYWPAIAGGRQIKMRRSPKNGWDVVQPWQMPVFDGEVIDTSIAVEGKTARVRCGVVKRGQSNPRCGFSYAHEWRLIEAASSNGCGAFNPAYVCGIVELDASWKLSRNKDAIHDATDALFLEVERVARPVLERAHERGIDLQSRKFQEQVNERVNLAVSRNRAKAKRSSPTRSGSHRATGAGAPHTRADREQDGPTFLSRHQSGRVNVTWGPMGEGMIGRVSLPNVVLNIDDPWVSHLVTTSNIDASVTIAMALLVDDDARQSRPLLHNIARDDSFPTRLSVVLDDLVIDGKPSLQIVQGGEA